jgi:hypothetical protein
MRIRRRPPAARIAAGGVGCCEGIGDPGDGHACREAERCVGIGNAVESADAWAGYVDWLGVESIDAGPAGAGAVNDGRGHPVPLSLIRDGCGLRRAPTLARADEMSSTGEGIDNVPRSGAGAGADAESDAGETEACSQPRGTGFRSVIAAITNCVIRNRRRLLAYAGPMTRRTPRSLNVAHALPTSHRLRHRARRRARSASCPGLRDRGCDSATHTRRCSADSGYARTGYSRL